MIKKNIVSCWIFCFAMTLIIFSCDSSVEEYTEKIDCHTSRAYEVESFQSDLIGVWTWTEMDCEDSSLGTNYAGLVIEFTATELIIVEDGVETARSNYEIEEKSNGDFWIIDEEDFPVTGRANYICGDELVMQGGLSLSCNVLYKKQ